MMQTTKTKSKKKATLKSTHCLPPFVRDCAQGDDSAGNSDTEEFNSADLHFDDYKVPSAHPIQFDIEDGKSLKDWFMTTLFKLLSCVEQSECYKRCTLWKITRRFLRLQTMDEAFYHIVNDLFPYDAEAAETLGSWLNRFKLTQLETFLEVAVLHYLHCYASFNKFDKRKSISIPEQVIAMYNELVQNMPELADRRFMVSLLREHHFPDVQVAPVPVISTLKGSLSDKHKERLITNLYIFLKPLYRFKLLHLLSLEKTERRRMVQLKFPTKNKPVCGLLGTPKYDCRPIKGPFKADFIGRSNIMRLYGSEPNPNFYYCNCSEDGSLCGHLPVGVRDYGFHFFA